MKKNIFVSSMIGVSLVLSSALPVMAQTTPPTTATTKSRFDVACMQSAVDARDTTLSTAIDALASAEKDALSARKDALKSAWAVTDKKIRNQAFKTAWSYFKSSHKTAMQTAKISRNQAWNTFYNTRKSCGSGAAAEDATTQQVDSLSL